MWVVFSFLLVWFAIRKDVCVYIGAERVGKGCEQVKGQIEVVIKPVEYAD